MGPPVNERRLNGVKEMDIVMMFIAGEGDIITHLVKPCKQSCVDVITHLNEFPVALFFHFSNWTLTQICLIVFSFMEVLLGKRWSYNILPSVRFLTKFLAENEIKVEFSGKLTKQTNLRRTYSEGE